MLSNGGRRASIRARDASQMAPHSLCCALLLTRALWLEAVHYKGNRVPCGTQGRQAGASESVGHSKERLVTDIKG